MIAFEVLTIFPDAVAAFVKAGLLGRAIRDGKVSVRATDIREFSTDRFRRIDDTPYGGGAGMLMRVEPVVDALEHVDGDDARRTGTTRRILLSPAAPRFDQRAAERLAAFDRVTLVCGRYEGIDDRVRDHVDEALSIGDFVLNGGEVAALVVIEAIARLREGVIGNVESARVESFAADTGRLEHPQYTRPPQFRGAEVPAVLREGNHERIDRWRELAALARTARWRPDLLGSEPGSFADMSWRLAWPGKRSESSARVVELRDRKLGALRRSVARATGLPTAVVTLTHSADPAGLTGPLIAGFLRELTRRAAEPGSAGRCGALFVPPGLGPSEAALVVPDRIFSLAKQASMIDISPPLDPGPLLDELGRALAGRTEEIP